MQTVFDLETHQESAQPNPAELVLQIGSDLERLEPSQRAYERIRRVLADGHPLVLAYSSGKDSSVLTGIALQVAKDLKQAHKPCPSGSSSLGLYKEQRKMWKTTRLCRFGHNWS